MVPLSHRPLYPNITLPVLVLAHGYPIRSCKSPAPPLGSSFSCVPLYYSLSYPLLQASWRWRCRCSTGFRSESGASSGRACLWHSDCTALCPYCTRYVCGGGGGGAHFCIAPAATRDVCVCVGQGRGVVGPLALAHLHGLSASPSSSSRRWDPAPFSTCPSPPPSMQMVLNRGVPQVQQALVIDLIMGATYIVSYQQHAIVHALRSLR